MVSTAAGWLAARLAGRFGPVLLVTLLALLLASSGAAGWQAVQAARARAQTADEAVRVAACKRGQAEHLAEDAAAQAEALRELRRMRSAMEHRMEQIDDEHEAARVRWLDEQKQLRGDLRAYRVRLRGHWAGAGCNSTAGTGEAGSSTGGADANALLRIRDAQRLVESAARCDRQIRGLQAATGVGR